MKHRTGFTLIELMVAMTAGAIAISSMFFISSASTHYFRVQQRLTNMQSSLRIAMDQLRRDVGRAGAAHRDVVDLLGERHQLGPQRLSLRGEEDVDVLAVVGHALAPHVAEPLHGGERRRSGRLH